MKPTSLLRTAALFFTLATASAFAIEPKDIPFKSTVDGTEQRYVELMPPDFDPANYHDLVITLHGHGSDRWQFIKNPRDECRAMRDVAKKIWSDYRLAGLSCEDLLDGSKSRGGRIADYPGSPSAL